MNVEQGIARELDFGEVLSRTFELYRRNFTRYFVIFLIVNAIVGIISFLAARAIVFSTLPPNPTPQQVSDYAASLVGPVFTFLFLVVATSVVFTAFADGVSVKLASEDIKTGQASLGSSVRFAGSKLIYILALQILLSIIVGLGFVALIVPGIILATMFFVAMPALLIEDAGVLGCLGRSRELVSHRWLKTFAIGLVIGLIVVVIVVVSYVIGFLFGSVGSVVTSILGALYGPLIPITATVYYYSNLARITPPPAGPAPMGQAAVAAPGMKFCPNCGTQLLSSATFCSNCGAKQPA